MRRISIAAVAAALLAATHTYAQPFAGEPCFPSNPDPQTPCTGLAGNGTLQCKPNFPANGASSYVCLPSPVQGPATLKLGYAVLTVIYAPPGTNGGGSASSVEYGQTSTTGTTTTGATSFNQGYAVTATVGLGPEVTRTTIGAGFAYAKSTTDSKSLEISQDGSTSKKTSGPAQDGIDHNEDLIVLWLNPRVDVTATQTSANWTFSNGEVAIIQEVKVGQLKEKSQLPSNLWKKYDLPAGLKETFNNAGITPADYPEILKRDPLAFVDGSAPFDPSKIDRSRFSLTTNSFTYSVPTEGGVVSTTTRTYTNTMVRSALTSGMDSYKVSASIEQSFKIPTLAKASLKAEGSWEWTNTSSNESKKAGSQTASVTIGGPAAGYGGPVNALVYYDTVYKTFMFALTNEVHIKGVVSDPKGQVVEGQEVTATAGGVVYRNFTDARGEYRFPYDIQGPIELQSGTARRTIPSASLNADLKLPPLVRSPSIPIGPTTSPVKPPRHGIE